MRAASLASFIIMDLLEEPRPPRFWVVEAVPLFRVLAELVVVLVVGGVLPRLEGEEDVGPAMCWKNSCLPLALKGCSGMPLSGESEKPPFLPVEFLVDQKLEGT